MWIAKLKNKTHISLRFLEKFQLKGSKTLKNESFFIFKGTFCLFRRFYSPFFIYATIPIIY